MSSRTHFGVVDQAMKSMKTVEEYIKVGMETTLDVGMDFVEHDKGNSQTCYNPPLDILVYLVTHNINSTNFLHFADKCLFSDDRGQNI